MSFLVHVPLETDRLKNICMTFDVGGSDVTMAIMMSRFSLLSWNCEVVMITPSEIYVTDMDIRRLNTPSYKSQIYSSPFSQGCHPALKH